MAALSEEDRVKKSTPKLRACCKSSCTRAKKQTAPRLQVEERANPDVFFQSGTAGRTELRRCQSLPSMTRMLRIGSRACHDEDGHGRGGDDDDDYGDDDDDDSVEAERRRR